MQPDVFNPIAMAEAGDPEALKTGFQIFADKLDGTDLFKFDDSVREDVVRKDNLPIIRGLDLLPAAPPMMQADQRLSASQYNLSYTFLFEKLQYDCLQRGYDYVLLDCPPNMFTITRNALFFAHRVIVPFNPDFLSISGLRFLAQLLDQMEETIAILNPALKQRKKIDAIVLNRWDKVGAVYEQARVTLRQMLQLLKTQKLISNDCKIVDPPIRTDVGIA